jgi:hypothetical protein
LTATPDEIRAALTGFIRPATPEIGTVADPVDGECRVVRRLVESFLLWESSLVKAERAMEAIRTDLVDFNELRVCLTTELVGIIGVRYPSARERSERIRTCLNTIFEQENRVDLRSLAPLSKRDARIRLDAMPGMVPFVSARVILLELGGHAFPVDSRIRGYLNTAGCTSENEASLASKLERAFRAGEIASVYAGIEQAIDQPMPKTGSRVN